MIKGVNNMKKNINSSYDKTTNTVCCPKCREIKSRTEMKYVGYIFSRYVFAICNGCRNKYQSNKFTRFLVRNFE